jgi:DNA-binding transcriptional LysR family regulator
MIQIASPPFDLRGLEVFIAVCEQGTMASAARLLGLTQPGVSQIIAEIETKTGAILFDRAVRPLGLTPAGVVLRQRATALLTEARQIAPLLREVERGRLPVVRVGLLDSMSRTLAAELAAKLLELTEQASLLSGLTDAHVSALLTRQLDLVFAVADFSQIEGLERWPILEEPYILLTPADMPEVKRPADLAEIARLKPLVRFSVRSKTGMDIERHLRRLGLDLPRAVEFDTPYGVTSTVAAGRGWCLTTPLCVQEAGLGLSGMRASPLPGPALSRHLILISRRRELSRLPHQIADFTGDALRAKFLPALERDMPWALDQVKVGG